MMDEKIMNVKEMEYRKLCADAKEHYMKLIAQGEEEMTWVDECEEINLWTYWQGMNSLSPKVLVVGQDWGSANDELGELFKKNVREIKKNSQYSIFTDIPDKKMFITDINLIKLFEHIGYDITKERQCKDLFFTNICLGYRTGKSSGNYNTKWIERDKDLFLKLVEILEPKVILCLGKTVFEGVTDALHKPVKIRGSYNGLIEERKPEKIIVGRKEIAVFALAHPGAMGTMNRNKIWDAEARKLITDPITKTDNLLKQKRDWEEIRHYL